MDKTQQLICGYLDGELTESEVALLSATLESNAVSLDRLVWSSFIHSQLLESIDPAKGDAYGSRKTLSR